MTRILRAVNALFVRPVKVQKKRTRVLLGLETLEEIITPDGTYWLDLASSELQQASTSSGTALIIHLENATYDFLQARTFYPNDPATLASIDASISSTENQLSPLLVGTNPLSLISASQVASTIASLQLPNGAIRYSANPAGYDANSRPYYLADAYFTGTALYWALGTPTSSGTDMLAVTKNWLNWCFTQADSNGMLLRSYYYLDGTAPASPAPFLPDAEDSNSAMILAVLGKYVSLGGDTSFLTTQDMKAKTELIASVMINLQQANGLTWGSTGYQISDTEDNSEVFAGFQGAAYVETTLYNDQTQAAIYTSAANRVQQGIMNLLYNPTTGLFDWALNSPSDLTKSWYPDTITQVWPILYGVLDPSSTTAQSILNKIQAVWTGNTHAQFNWQDRLDASSVALAQWLGGNTLSAETALLTTDQNPTPPNDGYPLYNTTIADEGFKLALLNLIAADRTSHPSSTTPPTTLPFADNFNRADSSSLGNFWGVQVGTATDSLDSLLSTSATTTATTTGTNLLNSATQATVSLAPTGDSYAVLVARYTGTGDSTMYTGGLVLTSGAISGTITRYVNGTSTVLAQSSLIPTAAQYQIRFEVVNDSLKLYVNGSLVAFTYDVAITAPGQVGIRLSNNSRLDDFTEDTITLLPVTLPPAPTLSTIDTFTQSTGSQLSRYWHERLGNISISASGQAVGQSAINLSTYNVPDTLNAGGQADVSFTATGQSAGIVLRYAGTTFTPDQNYYLGAITNLGGGQLSASISLNLNGVSTTLYTGTITGTGGTLRFEESYTTLKLYLNNTLIGVAYSTSLLSAGGVGVRLTSGAAVDNVAAYAVPTLPFYDPFTANGTTNQLNPFWTLRSGAFTVAANTALAQSPGANVATVAGISATDVVVSATVGAQVGPLLATGLVTRYQANGDMYWGALNVYGSPPYTGYMAEIWKYSGGVWTPININANPITPASTVGKTLRFEALGSSLKLYLNDVLLAFAVDTSISGAGNVGLRMAAGAVLDDFIVSARTQTTATLPFSDNFNTTNPQGSLATTWQDRSGFTLASSASQRAVGGSASQANLSTLNGVNSANVTMSADLFFTAGGQSAQLVARYQGSAGGTGDDNFYFAAFDTQANGSVTVRIAKKVSGVVTTLASTTLVGYFPGTNFNPANPPRLSFRIVNNVLSVSLNNFATTLLISNDTSLASGSVGIRTSQGVGMDNFNATTP